MHETVRYNGTVSYLVVLWWWVAESSWVLEAEDRCREAPVSGSRASTGCGGSPGTGPRTSRRSRHRCAPCGRGGDRGCREIRFPWNVSGSGCPCLVSDVHGCDQRLVSGNGCHDCDFLCPSSDVRGCGPNLENGTPLSPRTRRPFRRRTGVACRCVWRRARSSRWRFAS